MDRFAQWVNDWRWAANMVRARRWRRDLLFSQREKFDRAFRPKIDARTVVEYPDAVYHVSVDDLIRAMTKSRSSA